MRKIKEALRLRFDLGLTQDQIAIAGILPNQPFIGIWNGPRQWVRVGPLPAGCDDRQLERVLFPTTPGWEPRTVRPMPDLAAIHEQLQSNKHVTLQLLWEEYREGHPNGYSYSRFCELYETWRRQQNVVLRQEHRAGEKMFVDWAGANIPVFDRDTGDCQAACLFVAVPGASSYTFAYARRSRTDRCGLCGAGSSTGGQRKGPRARSSSHRNTVLASCVNQTSHIAGTWVSPSMGKHFHI